MTKRKRSTLRRYFSKGKLPRQDHFYDLIDSTLNPIDEGFDKSLEHGFEISLIGKHRRLLSFFKADQADRAVWTIEYDGEQDRLLIRRPETESDAGKAGEADQDANAEQDDNAEKDAGKSDPAAAAPIAMTFSADSQVGINNTDPRHALDVGGVVAMRGRIGTVQKDYESVAANGKWQKIAGPLHGCQAVEVIAGVGKKNSGKFSLMHAIAMNAYNPRGWFFNFLNLKKRIKYHHAYFLSRGDRIKLRWQNEEDGYYLEIRTLCRLEGDIRIQYYLTWLWFDENMSGSRPLEGKAE